jgi:hypothetical protein
MMTVLTVPPVGLRPTYLIEIHDTWADYESSHLMLTSKSADGNSGPRWWNIFYAPD